VCKSALLTATCNPLCLVKDVKLQVYLLVYRRLRVRLIGRVHSLTRDLSLQYTVSVYELTDAEELYADARASI
jgi:hypothetical protein